MLRQPILAVCLGISGLCPTPIAATAQAAQAAPLAPTEGEAMLSGGVSPETAPPPTRRRELRARLLKNGLASVPADAPPAVQRAIRAANRIIGKPYVYGGGHASFQASGYDCSGSVSYALHGGRWLSQPMASGALMGWGQPGRGRWVTVYANGGHAFAQIAGLRLDTSSAGDPRGGEGPRWRPRLRDTSGYTARHPRGF